MLKFYNPLMECSHVCLFPLLKNNKEFSSFTYLLNSLLCIFFFLRCYMASKLTIKFLVVPSMGKVLFPLKSLKVSIKVNKRQYIVEKIKSLKLVINRLVTHIAAEKFYYDFWKESKFWKLCKFAITQNSFAFLIEV